jgi:HEPN domain-containing protein
LYIGDDVPRTHNIVSLFQAFEDRLSDTVDDACYDLFEKLHAFYLNGRYTNFKRKMSALVNEKEAKNTLKQTKEAYTWLLTLKP